MNDKNLECRNTTEMNLYLPEEQCRMLKYLKYFDDWVKQAKELKKTDKNWSTTIPAIVTIKNLKVLICGFFGYASKLLKKKEHFKIFCKVSFLQSNQSTVENLFSQLRAFNRDKAELIGKGMLATQVNGNWKQNITRNNNKMYTGTTIVENKDDEKTSSETFFYAINDEKRQHDLTEKIKKKQMILVLKIMYQLSKINLLKETIQALEKQLKKFQRQLECLRNLINFLKCYFISLYFVK